MRNNQTGSGLILVIAVAALLLLGTVSFVLWQNLAQGNEPAINTSEANQGNDGDEDVDPYIGWKTYSSSRDGYSIKYPGDWIVINESDNDGPYIRNMEPISSDGGYPDGYINLRVLKYTPDSFGDMTATEWYNALGKSSVTKGPITYAPDSVSSFTVNGIDGKRSKTSFSEINEVIFLLHDSNVYEINLYPFGASDNDDVKMILNSFNFD